MDRLVQVGFESAGKWRLVGGACVLELDLNRSMAEQRDVLYAFAVDGALSYVGKTALSLRERLQQYKTPARSAKSGGSTNIKNNRNIIAALSSGQSVEIFILRTQDQQRHGEFHVSLAAGLEKDLIDALTPPWNKCKPTTVLPALPSAPKPPPTIKHAHLARTEPRLSKVDFQNAIHKEFVDATAAGLTLHDIYSGPLHTKVGVYPRPGHSMPTCCNAMYAEMRPGDEVRKAPPKGKGATLVIRYRLPRVN